MNIKFIRNVALDAILFWPCIVLGGVYHNVYAENAIGFYGVMSLIFGILLMITVDKIPLKPEFKRSKNHLRYMQISSGLEILACAAFGWYWTAAGFLIFGMAMSRLIARFDTEQGK